MTRWLRRSRSTELPELSTDRLNDLVQQDEELINRPIDPDRVAYSTRLDLDEPGRDPQTVPNVLIAARDEPGRTALAPDP